MADPNEIECHTIISRGADTSEKFLKSLGYEATKANNLSATKPYFLYDKVYDAGQVGKRGVLAIVTTETVTFCGIPAVLQTAIKDFETKRSLEEKLDHNAITN